MTTPSTPATAPSCYWHPDRATLISCTRCHRPICPDCMRSAAVGQHCIACVNEGAKSVRQPRTVLAGGTPVVTYALIAVNVVMFVLQSTSAELERQFVLWTPAIAHGEVWRLATSAFLHYGVTHLLFNMWALYVIGPPLEQWLGRSRFISLYALSGLGGSVLVYLLSPIDSATAGASGAIFGLFGATFALARHLNFDVKWVLGLIAFNLIFTFLAPLLGSQPISWQGHVGGLLTGAAMGGVYAYAPRANRTAIQVGASIAVLLLLVALVWWRTTSLLTGVG